MMKAWNFWLVFTTFGLCILGTMLTRSGVVSSVHAFAQSSIGPWFAGFLAFILAVCLAAYLKNRDYLRSDNQLDSLVSRESSFLFNNLILLLACVAVISGTLFPVLTEAVQGTQISVGPPFFNKVNIPIGLFLLFLTGVGPLLAWRKTSLDSLKRNFAWPLIGGLVFGAICIAQGARDFYAAVSLTLSGFVALTIASEFWRGASVIRARTGSGFLAAVGQLTMRNTRRYGGYVVHFAMVLIFIGLAGAAFNQDKQLEMQPGSRLDIGPYTLVLQAFTSPPPETPNYSAERASIEALREGRPLMMLYPERRTFPASEVTSTMVAIHSTLNEDLYVVYAGRSPENGQPVIHAYLNPLVKWIWLGGVVLMLGTGLALLPNRQPAFAIVRAAQPEIALAPAEGVAAAVPQGSLRSGD